MWSVYKCSEVGCGVGAEEMCEIGCCTLRSIGITTDFLLNNRNRAIYRSTQWVLSANIRSHTEFRLLIFDSVWVIICKVSFLYTSWRRQWAESCHKILFQNRSICDRNTSIGAKGLLEWASEQIKRFYVVFSISRRKGDGKRWREWWPSKIDSNWRKKLLLLLLIWSKLTVESH